MYKFEGDDAERRVVFDREGGEWRVVEGMMQKEQRENPRLERSVKVRVTDRPDRSLE
jgi:hypothetical protein